MSKLEHEGVEVEDAGILKELEKNSEAKNEDAFKRIKIKKTKIIPQKEIEVETSVEELEMKKEGIEMDIEHHQKKLEELQERLLEIDNDIKEIEIEAKKLI
jgi:hypothetical protein